MISVIIPTYNRKDSLMKLLNSLSEMKQSDLEVIVIDDDSNYNLKGTLDSKIYPFKLIYKRNINNQYSEKCRRLGFELSKGEYIVFCDDDDYYYSKSFFKKAQEILENNKELAFVSGNASIEYVTEKNRRINKPLNKVGRIHGLEYLYNFQFDYDKPLSTFTTVFRRTCVEKRVTYFNDSSIYLGCLLEGDALILPEFIGSYCIHNCNISHNIKYSLIKESIESKYEIYKKLPYSENSKKWLTLQIWFTLRYYFYESAISFDVARNVINEMNNQYPLKKCYLMRLKLMVYLKSNKKYLKDKLNKWKSSQRNKF